MEQKKDMLPNSTKTVDKYISLSSKNIMNKVFSIGRKIFENVATK